MAEDREPRNKSVGYQIPKAPPKMIPYHDHDVENGPRITGCNCSFHSDRVLVRAYQGGEFPKRITHKHKVVGGKKIKYCTCAHPEIEWVRIGTVDEEARLLFPLPNYHEDTPEDLECPVGLCISDEWRQEYRLRESSSVAPDQPKPVKRFFLVGRTNSTGPG